MSESKHTPGPCLRWAVERRFPDGSVGRLGTVAFLSSGYRFTPAVSGRRPSAKLHGTMAAALPRWVGYPHACETRALCSPNAEAR
jgi:hypothetical protein